MTQTPRSPSPQPGQPGRDQGFDFSNSITPEEYQTLQKEKADFQQKQLAARGEFMFQHYERLLKAVETSLERASTAVIRLERKQRRQQVRERKEQLRALRKATQGR
ncbi:hypothetical protein [Thermogemmatispora tikiterensis]|uniref:Uncharacterized protein n=1 Tax=Thermogemmatispora tikiterensis TaxID=1825093 RepID=A0A328VNX7_9CHLR|nr:hypothetical protein [Thermogemmatispora tikiterensis]RAQ97490.1 hypothetical protein A4R35_18280 [Thermogemmatispora tikiterensis]